MKTKKYMNIRIGHRLIGEGQPTFIIAEIGSNHNCDLKMAKKMIREIGKTGADAVKFQTFKADLLVNKRFRPKAYNLLKKNEMPREWHKTLKEYAEEHGLVFMATPFDREAVDLLNRLRVSAYKVASGDITNIPLIRHMARSGKPLIMSVGAANDRMIQAAIEAVKKAGNNKIVLCQCVVNYPTEYSDANVRVLTHLKDRFKTLVGYSDHSREELVPVLAVAQGAAVIEKHVTLSRSLEGPDHNFALEIGELKQLVTDIRRAEAILGQDDKVVLEAEKQAFYRARRGLYFNKPMRRGSRIREDDLSVLRPARGLLPAMMGGIIGKKLNKGKNTLDPVYAKDIVNEIL